MFKTRFALAASVATIALAGCGSSTSSTASTNSGSAASGSGSVTATSPTATDVSGAPTGNRPQMQTVTGTAADKASAAATAKYPGTVQQVVKVGTGYGVDITTTSGATKHVQVSAAFVVTGLMTAPSGGPGNGTPPTGVQPKNGGPSATTPAAVASS